MSVSAGATNATNVSPFNPSADSVQATRSKEAAKQIGHVIKGQGIFLEERCEIGAIRDALLAAKWHRTNLWLGTLAAITAALAAFVGGNGQIIQEFVPHGARGAMIASVFALISAVLTSILTFLAPSERAGAYHHFSNKLRALRDKARSFVEIDCALNNNKDAALSEKLQRLVRQKSEIDSGHPIIPHSSYDKAYVEMKKKFKRKQAWQQAREESVAGWKKLNSIPSAEQC